MKKINSQPTVVSTFASPHSLSRFIGKPTLKPKAFKRVSASPARVTAFQDGFRIARAQKNKINLCFVDRLVQLDNDKQTDMNEHQLRTKALFNKGLGGNSSILPRSNFDVVGQESSPHSATISYRQSLAIFNKKLHL